MKLRWVEEVGPQPESRAIANAKWLRDNFCLSSSLHLEKRIEISVFPPLSLLTLLKGCGAKRLWGKKANMAVEFYELLSKKRGDWVIGVDRHPLQCYDY